MQRHDHLIKHSYYLVRFVNIYKVMFVCEFYNVSQIKRYINTRLAHLVSTGIEEVAQTDDVAVVQLPHDLKLTVLSK